MLERTLRSENVTALDQWLRSADPEGIEVGSLDLHHYNVMVSNTLVQPMWLGKCYTIHHNAVLVGCNQLRL